MSKERVEAKSLFDYITQLQQENKQLKDKINQALHKLNASKNHFKTQRENNAVIFTIKILGDKENE